MRVSRYISFPLFFLIAFFSFSSLQAQLGFDLTIKKPEPYDNRELKAEKTPDKKIKQPRRTLQNLTTHYNYFFNAQAKIAEIIDRAKAAHKDDYALLLPFYNYSLETTAGDSAQLDSVIYKSKTGIVLHDLRNDWIDDLYLLWGAAYHLRQDFDSAYQMFQFINYAFAEKEKDGYYRYIGSRIDGNNATSIATKENENLLQRMLSDPPSRNTAFIWQIRTMIEQNALPEAGSLIATLKNDPVFPERLHGALEEVQAYWFYKQKLWDSAAYHLVNALSEAPTKKERGRWEYLAAQLFERKDLIDLAKQYYTKSIGHTTDPVLEVYARLNLIRINKEGDNGYIDRNIAELVKMAKRDKYADYRDVIYSMVAQMELERGNLAAAQDYLVKASKYKTDNILASNRAYLQLAELAFARRDYLQASSFYDSVRMDNLEEAAVAQITGRKATLTRLMVQLNAIAKLDSLQKLAAMPEAERDDIIRKMVRQLRKEQGLKDEEATTTAGRPVETVVDPFAAQQTKGEWYFYNENLRTNGLASFRQAWGNRPNVDNWRRFTDVTSQLRNTLPNSGRDENAGTLTDDPLLPPTYDVLLARLPLTPEKLAASNDSLRTAYYAAGNIYVNELEDYVAAVALYEQFRSRFGLGNASAELLFNLYYSYLKAGEKAKAEEIKKLLLEKYPTDRFATILRTGKDPLTTRPSEDITKVYEGVYDLYLEGRFTEAKAEKQKADSIYKTNYWSPQLLYIEAVYHIRQREDSIAKLSLNQIVQQNPGTPLAAKAENMINVLNRRSEIEAELTSLQVERPVEDTLYVEPMPIAPAVVKKDTVVAKPKDVVVNKPVVVKPVTDSLFKKPAPVKTNSLYTFNASSPHYAVIVLNKVDPVFGNEARNAFDRHNKEKFYSQPLEIKSAQINDDVRLLLVGTFTNVQGAVDYIQKTKPIAASQIVPWLKADKFSFTIITEENLQTLTGTKDFAAYQQFLDQNLPVKF